MPYDPRAFPTLTAKKPGPTPGAPAREGATKRRDVDQEIRERKQALVRSARKTRIAVASGLAALLFAAFVTALWWATRTPDVLPYKPRQISSADLGQWYRAMEVLARLKNEGKFGGMPGGPLEFAREQSENPDLLVDACERAGVSPFDVIVTCDAIGAAMIVEAQDRKAEEHVANLHPENPELAPEVPEELRLEVEFGKKGTRLAPPKLSDHLNPTDKENFKLYMANRDTIQRTLDTVR